MTVHRATSGRGGISPNSCGSPARRAGSCAAADANARAVDGRRLDTVVVLAATPKYGLEERGPDSYSLPRSGPDPPPEYPRGPSRREVRRTEATKTMASMAVNELGP